MKLNLLSKYTSGMMKKGKNVATQTKTQKDNWSTEFLERNPKTPKTNEDYYMKNRYVCYIFQW